VVGFFISSLPGVASNPPAAAPAHELVGCQTMVYPRIWTMGAMAWMKAVKFVDPCMKITWGRAVAS